MSSATLLELVQSASVEMGLAAPTQVVGNTSDQVTQLYYLLNAAGDELMREYDWEALKTEYRFTTNYLITTGDTTEGSAVITNIPDTSTLSNKFMVNGTGINQDTTIVSVDSSTQITVNQAASADGTGVTLNFGQTIYDLPSSFDRQIDRTHYDKSKRWEMLGPETPQQIEFLRSSYISTGPRIRYWFQGGKFQIWPLTTTNEYLGYEYISNLWAKSSLDVGQSSFEADTDTCIFPKRLMIDALKLKFFGVKGFDVAQYMAQYMRQLNIAKANDAGSPVLSFAPRVNNVLVGYENIPDGSIYGQG